MISESRKQGIRNVNDTKIIINKRKEIKMDSTNGEVGSTVSAKTKRERRTWPAELSVRLCREVVFLRPYQFVPRSEERTSTWELIIDNLQRDDV